MAQVLMPLANGFEEIEAFATVDILRRAGILVDIAGVGGTTVSSVRGISVNTDIAIEKADSSLYDLIVLPGGLPGAHNLHDSPVVQKLLQEFKEQQKYTAAICAAPYVLESAGILKGKQATSYPSFKDKLHSATYSEDVVVIDEKVITSRGPATAPHFAFALVELLAGKEKAEEIQKAMLYHLI